MSSGTRHVSAFFRDFLSVKVAVLLVRSLHPPAIHPSIHPSIHSFMPLTPPQRSQSLPASQRFTSPLSPTSSRLTTGTTNITVPRQAASDPLASATALTGAMTQPGVLGFSASTSPQPTPDVNVITSGGPALVNNTEQGVRVKESDAKATEDKAEEQTDVEPVVLGVCAMDVKARSKAMREILTRLVEIEKGGVNVKLFGDMVILEEGTSPPSPLISRALR